ncbi:uncharacterized protein LOC142238139 [Haematobia irritans]|uniref:uncharacterized protein LOC142238139 n=1 Tax=Haematobia irritans TaxID=7368 RepID=UPI003F50ACBE
MSCLKDYLEPKPTTSNFDETFMNETENLIEDEIEFAYEELDNSYLPCSFDEQSICEIVGSINNMMERSIEKEQKDDGVYKFIDSLLSTVNMNSQKNKRRIN